MWLFFTFLTVLLWGVGQVFVKKGFSETTPLFNNLLSAAVTLLITIPFALLNGANINDVFSLLPLTIFIALLLLCYYYIIGIGQLSLTVESGVVSYYLAISQGLLSLVTPLSSIYATVTVILAWFILHERINKIQILGIICSVIGIVLIGS